MSPIRIQGRRVGPREPVYIIAELSANHRQKFEEAEELIRLAGEAEADAVKLQTYTPDTITISCENRFFKIPAGSPWEGRSLHDLYAEAYMPWEWHRPLMEVAARAGMALFSTPFDPSAVEYLEELDMPAYKIASFELVDLPLIQMVAETGKPVILSTGMANLQEIQDAVNTVLQTGNNQLALLKCTSAYPARPEEMNLRTIPHLADTFQVPVGISDHSLGLAAPVAAVALGACIVEKHITLTREKPGPDSGFSLEPDEFKAMVRAVRETEAVLGGVVYEATPQERVNLCFRRSLFAVSDIKRNEVFTRENVRSIRPCYGLAPKHLARILGKKAAREIPRGTPLSWDLIS
jgi:pseudaminic acid synthase